ncbi:acylphosphatase [Geopsychrobacter electrodiphilus]|uniref:acylphosphatase n=1 Tax=Geopsychrobacter electrodiphilus TaxID=225196 RepID=UPI00035FECA5|nr:acylphosphatase [Geopsychrobacter electrodiphilus]
MMQICRRLLISGRVQGVSFRYYTRQAARKNGVTGWVRNLPDGRVEALIEGEQQAVEATLVWCQQGPELSQVDGLEIEELTYSGVFESFTIR